MKYCKYCDREVKPRKEVNWIIVLLLIVLTGGGGLLVSGAGRPRGGLTTWSPPPVPVTPRPTSA